MEEALRGRRKGTGWEVHRGKEMCAERESKKGARKEVGQKLTAHRRQTLGLRHGACCKSQRTVNSKGQRGKHSGSDSAICCSLERSCCEVPYSAARCC